MVYSPGVWEHTCPGCGCVQTFTVRDLAWRAVPYWGAESLSEAASELGRRGGAKGGRARAAALTPGQRSKIARNAALARWRNHDARDD
jgi:hypothetical protein